MNKAEARRLYNQKRVLAEGKDLVKWQDRVLIHFQEIQLPPLQVIHSYLPAGHKREVDPEPLVEFLAFRNPGLKVLAPQIDPLTLGMRHILMEEHTEFTLNTFGIPEPADGQDWPVSLIDLVFVPLLAFDLSGHRVGYGKGYYDRFLAHCRKDTLKVGLSFFEPETRISDTGSFDIRLDYCVTPYRYYAF